MFMYVLVLSVELLWASEQSGTALQCFLQPRTSSQFLFVEHAVVPQTFQLYGLSYTLTCISQVSDRENICF